MNKIKTRTITLVLYDESMEHKTAMEYIEKNYKYAKILHDKDIDKDGNTKKSHYHYVIIFDNPRYIDAIAKELNIKTNEIEQVKNLKLMLRYLTHIDNKEKYQYNVSDIKTNIEAQVQQAYQQQRNKKEELTTLIKLLRVNNRYMSVIEVSEILINMNMVDFAYNKSHLIKTYVEDHNKTYYQNVSEEEQAILDEEENNLKWKKLDEELEEILKEQGRL